MAEKKSKKDKKKRKKKKKKKVRISEDPKKPSEKSIFKKKVEELEEELVSISQKLKEEEASLEQLILKHSEVVESKEACVKYLKRVLQEKTENVIEVQRRLQWVRDITELTEQRAGDLSRNLHRSFQLKKSVFMQQRLELEEKLSRLEEVRLKRTSQLTHLKRLEEDLEKKTTAERKTKQKVNMEHVNRLLKKREDFERYVDSIGSDAEEVFEANLPVFAKNQLEENIRLRAQCQEASDNLLVVQERSRSLKDTKKLLDLEKEIQKSAKIRLNDFQARLQGHQSSLLIENAYLQSERSIGRDDLRDIQSEIRANQRKISHTVDKISNVEEILRDQGNYTNSLVQQMEKKIDWNGLRISKVMRAGQILKAKIKEVEDKRSCIDSDLLKQIRMLLDED